MRLYHGGVGDPTDMTLVPAEIKKGTYLSDNMNYVMSYARYKATYTMGVPFIITVDVDPSEVDIGRKGGSFYGTWYVLKRKPKAIPRIDFFR